MYTKARVRGAGVVGGSPLTPYYYCYLFPFVSQHPEAPRRPPPPWDRGLSCERDVQEAPRERRWGWGWGCGEGEGEAEG